MKDRERHLDAYLSALVADPAAVSEPSVQQFFRGVMGCLSSKAPATKLVKKYSQGFNEHAYRLVFPYEDHFPGQEPDLVTILPNGVVENTKKLIPEKERGLIAYTYSQKIEATDMENKKISDSQSQYNDKTYPETPFVKTLPGNKYALVQTWPTKFNDKFKQDFELSDTNPNPKNFEGSAVNDFKACMQELFGKDFEKKVPIKYAHRTQKNESPIYLGMTEDLQTFFKANPDEMKSLSIKEMTPDGFMSSGEDGKGTKVEKPFTMLPKTEYVVYKKQGWETMGCCKPKDQFEKECDFIGPETLIAL
jgi:hypothetical protein